jgi:hypothetical protein
MQTKKKLSVLKVLFDTSLMVKIKKYNGGVMVMT